jgi:hypothetical protein
MVTQCADRAQYVLILPVGGYGKSVSAVSSHLHEKCLLHLEKCLEASDLYFFCVWYYGWIGIKWSEAASIYILLLLTDPQRSPTIALL